MIYEDFHLLPSLLKTHGVVMGLAWVVVYPLGALFIRVFKFKGAIWAHVACQMLGFILMLVGLGTGIRIGKIIDNLHNNVHTILGTIVVVMMIFQPIIGFIHHYQYRKTQSRTWWSYLHIWYGRILIFLAIITGGIGLKLAKNTKGGEIAYGVVGGLVGLAYIVAITYMEIGRSHIQGRSKSDTEGADAQNTTCN